MQSSTCSSVLGRLEAPQRPTDLLPRLFRPFSIGSFLRQLTVFTMPSLTMGAFRLLLFCSIAVRQLQGASLPFGDLERLANAEQGKSGLASSRIGSFISQASSHTPEAHHNGWQHVPDTYYSPRLATSAGPSSRRASPGAWVHLDHDVSADIQHGVTGTGLTQTAPTAFASDHLPYDQSYLRQSFGDFAWVDQQRVLYPSDLYVRLPMIFRIPEMSEAERYDKLEGLREQIYHLSGVNLRRVTGVEPLIVPYNNHLSMPELSYVISHMTGIKRAPWLWHFGGIRFLLRQGWPNTQPFVLANGFKAGDYNRIFFEAWQEIGEPDSEVFQYLGVFRVPNRGKINPLKAQKLDTAFFPVEQFRILSPSTFTTKGQMLG